MGTIAKALSLLDLFSEVRPELGLTEVVRLSRQDKATVHRHLRALSQAGFVEQNAATRAYRLGPAILRLAHVREATLPLRASVGPIVDDLSERLGELVHVSVLSGTTLTSLHHADLVQRGIRVSFNPGEVLELHATSSGLAVLAHLPAAEAEAALSRPLEALTPRTVTDPESILRRLPEIRKAGYAESSETMEVGVASVAVPVFGPSGRVAGGLAAAFPVARATADRRAASLSALKAAAPDISACLGGAVPGDVRAAWAA